jgi:RNA polymerase sigma-70 factor (ECF subfamily)
MTIDGVDKLLLRSRQKIKEEKIILEEPPPQALEQRLPIVHKIIYLTFNEGYKSSGGKDILREELCEEALILNQTLLNSNIRNRETEALQALMLFNCARFSSRFSASGALLDLESQDRSLWNQDLIQLAHDLLNRSQSAVVSTYHLEAAIACLHCVAKSFALTEWKTIAGIYARLLQINNNPFVELNYAIALFYAGEKEAAFTILHRLERHAFLNQYYLLNMTLGKFHHLEGNGTLARQYLQTAYRQTDAAKEKDFIQNMIDHLQEPTQ